MDTNSKSKGKKLIHASIFTILAILIFSITTVSIYLPISYNQVRDDDFSNYLRSQDFGHKLGDLSRQVIRLDEALYGRPSYYDVGSVKKGATT